MIRCYEELARFDTLEERYKYLKLQGEVGHATFGHDRWMNQQFYTSRQWRHIRNYVISRDEGCDLGIRDYEIHSRLYIHHMNPIQVQDLVHGNADILDPEFLITVSHRTHNAIHYGDERQLPRPFVPRSEGDTKLWGKKGTQ